MSKIELTKSGKVPLQVLLPKDLYIQVIEYAPSYYGKARGGVSRLVEDAIKNYLEILSAHTNQHKLEINPSISLRDEYNLFIRELTKYRLEYNLPRYPVIKLSTARMIIMRAFKRAKDERTQFRKLHNWFLNGFIKPLAPPGIKPRKPSDWKRVYSIELVMGEVYT